MLTPGRFRRPHLRRGRARSRGQAVVEFALILPVFLLLTLGVVDMARLFTSYISLTNGVSSAAIYAGSGSYLAWCASGAAIPCPAGTLAVNMAPDPGNVAYQILIDSTGLTPASIAMSRPKCTPSSGPDVDCTSTNAGAYSKVTIVASYAFTFLTPIVSNVTGPITMTASTSAAVLN